jgi:transcription factor IIIB 90 kDa subunit
VNVFELGHVYLQLVQALHLQLPLIDPAHHISRFAALLEFGDDTGKVAADAVRLVQRFDRDWLARGRRPAGVCGAALLLAARMNHFRRSVEEIVQVVKIADSTLKKRLEEFKATPSAQLSLADFRAVWLEEEMDPPAFTKGREKEEEARMIATGEEPERKKKRGRKRKRNQADEEPKPWELSPEEQPALEAGKDGPEEDSPRIDPALLNSGILAGTSEVAREPLFLPDPADKDGSPQPADAYATPPPTLPPMTHEDGVDCDSPLTQPQPARPPLRRRAPSDPSAPPLTPPPTNPVDQAVDTVIGEDISSFLTNDQGTQLRSALDDADTARQAHGPHIPDDPDYDPNWADGLDDDELQGFVLSEEEAKIKERVWVELNREYLEAIAGMYLHILHSYDCEVDEGFSER